MSGGGLGVSRQFLTSVISSFKGAVLKGRGSACSRVAVALGLRNSDQFKRQLMSSLRAFEAAHEQCKGSLLTVLNFSVERQTVHTPTALGAYICLRFVLMCISDIQNLLTDQFGLRNLGLQYTTWLKVKVKERSTNLKW